MDVQPDDYRLCSQNHHHGQLGGKVLGFHFPVMGTDRFQE